MTVVSHRDLARQPSAATPAPIAPLLRAATGCESGRLTTRTSGIRAARGRATIAGMNVALTGATGFIGSHVLTELQQHGHEVTALVRDDARAETVASRRYAGRRRPPRPIGGRERAARCRRGDPCRRARASRRAPDSTRRLPMRRSTHSPAAASPSPTSAACGSTGTTPGSADASAPDPPALVAWQRPIERAGARRAAHARSRDRGRRRSVTAVAGSPGCCSARRATTPAAS